MIIEIAQIMDRIGEELHQAARDVETIEHAIGRAVESPGTSLHLAFDLQQLDKLRQHMAELARFAKSVAPTVDRSVVVDVNAALADVLLGDLKHRLQRGSSAQRSHTTAAGDCELL